MQRAYEIAYSFKSSELNWGQTGPDLMNMLLDQENFLQTSEIGDPRLFQPIGGYQIEMIFSPFSRPQIAQAHTLHLYNELWRRNGKNKNGPFPPRSLISELLELSNVNN